MYASTRDDKAMTIGEGVPQRAEKRSAAITVEHGLYAMIFVVALGLRVFDLGALPLSPNEAASAWPAWLAGMAVSAPNPPQPLSALLHSFQFLAVWLAQGDDTLMRLLPALAGAVLVLTPWFWRRWLGRVACLAAAGLMAIDPWLTTLSRTGDGAMVSAFLGVLTLTALLHVQAAPTGDGAAPSVQATGGWPVAVALAGGLLLVSGVQAWSWLFLVACFVVIMGVHRFSSLLHWSTLAWFGAAVVLGATSWLARPQDMSIVSASLTDWLAQVWFAGYPASWPWVRLVVDQPFLLLFGLVGVLTAGAVGFGQRAPENRRLVYFWVAWLILTVLLVAAPGRTPYVLPMLSLALVIPAGVGVAALIHFARQEEDWREGGLLLAVLTALFLSLLFWLTAIGYSRAPDAVLIRAVLVLIALGLFLVIAFAVWINRRQALLIALGLMGAALLVASISATWRLNFEHDPRRVDGFFARMTHPDVRQLALDVARLSDHRLGDASELPVQIVTGSSLTPDPAVSWELRRMRNLSWPAAPEPGAESDPRRAPVVISHSGAPGPQNAGQAYMGSDYRVRMQWLPGELPGLSGETTEGELWGSVIRPWLRWAIYREATTPPQVEMVTLWTLGE